MCSKIKGGYFILLLFIGFFAKTQDFEWIVPPQFKRLVNPVALTPEALKTGKSLYKKHCLSCHGKTGVGDGPKADEVIGDLGDFSSTRFQAQTDGDLYYKSYEGRDFMPSYRLKIPNEEDMWCIVHYMRSMGPASGG